MQTSTAQRTKVPADTDFHKSTYSQGATNCVEVAEGPTTAVRDTQNRDLGHLSFPGAEWSALLGACS